VSAVLFAVIHWHPIGFPMYAIIGLVFCWVYRRTGNLWAPVCGHVIYNAIVVGIPLLAPAAG
ncbi:MAG: CPBP family intramembrane metalloprotease, partial [Acidobacteria bacterium]|nr:CPBP family intramembrane metalloprotease [Acidobacteriota bacterium]